MVILVINLKTPYKFKAHILKVIVGE